MSISDLSASAAASLKGAEALLSHAVSDLCKLEGRDGPMAAEVRDLHNQVYNVRLAMSDRG